LHFGGLGLSAFIILPRRPSNKLLISQLLISQDGRARFYGLGSTINSAAFEDDGYAEVDGFYRFPSFESHKGERCQRDYSAAHPQFVSAKGSFYQLARTGTTGRSVIWR